MSIGVLCLGTAGRRASRRGDQRWATGRGRELNSPVGAEGCACDPRTMRRGAYDDHLVAR
jgi:hypothetical protein